MNTIEFDVKIFNKLMIEEEYPFTEQEKKAAKKASKMAEEAFEKGLIKPLEFRNV